MNLSEIFETIASRFDADKMSSLNATVQFDLGDTDHYLQVADGKVSHGEGNVDNADATIIMSQDDFQALTTGKLNPMAAFMQGKIKVDGDMGAVMKLQGLLSG